MDDRHQVTPYPLRMPADLRKRLEDEAQRIGRSLNAEIVARLQASYEPPPEDDDPTQHDLRFQVLVKTLELSHAANFLLSMRSHIPEADWEANAMRYFIKKYRLPPEVEARLDQEYAEGQSDLIKALLQNAKPKKIPE